MPRRFRGAEGTSQRMPVELLALAGPLLEQGREVRIVDGNVEERALDRVRAECEGALCLGVSCILGHQITDGAAAARRVREALPRLPIIWGGWFPTTMPEPFFREDLADAVVSGQGEVTFADLATHIERGADLEEVPGIVLQRDGELCHTASRKIADLNDLPPMPFGLLDYERYFRSDPSYPMLRHFYEAARGDGRFPETVRTFWYVSSWGCPNNCRFCCSPAVTGRRWTALKPDRMAGELEGLMRRHRLDVICFCDANFFASPRRVLEYCRLARESMPGILWIGTGEPETLVLMGEDGARAIAESGCFAIFVGAESGSRETLGLIDKDYDPALTADCTRLLLRHGIVPILSYMVGLQGEPERSVEETIEQCCRIKAAHPNVPVTILRYLPLPGSGLYAGALEAGFQEPESLEAWGETGEVSYYGRSALKVLTRSQEKAVSRLRYIYFWWLDLPWAKGRLGRIERLLRGCALFRLKHRLLSFPVEFLAWRLVRYGARAIRRSTRFPPSTQ